MSHAAKRFAQVRSPNPRLHPESEDSCPVFIDALCEPPEAFTFGGMFAHVIPFNTYRRLTALDALRRLGVNVEGIGCPTEYETSVAPWRTELTEERK